MKMPVVKTGTFCMDILGLL